MDLQQIFNDTDFVHTSGTKEELQVAGYLKMQCENMGCTDFILCSFFARSCYIWQRV